MADKTSLDSRYQAISAALASRDQGHALEWWPELNSDQRDQLLGDLEAIPWDLLDGLMASHVRGCPEVAALDGLQPAAVLVPGSDGLSAADCEKAAATGRERLTACTVAAFTVAGGQGTRLGFDGPKGMLPVTPVGSRTLFELFAVAIRTSRSRYGVAIPWYIMTSPGNHRQTCEYLSQNDFFGLPAEDVILFPQGMLPVFGMDGKLLLDEKHRLALAPDGHGGSLRALVASGAITDMKDRGVTTVSYFQVDNPLVKPLDPLFIGLHAQGQAEMSTKVTPKSDDLERVGNVCTQAGRALVVEYSDFPDELAHARQPDGSRRFDAGNLAIHLFDVAFIERLAGVGLALPFRRAVKKVPYIAADGSRREPAEPNAIKLEMFVFDVLPEARNPLVLQVDRAEEFSPVKNATGVDSLESSKRDQVRRACRWLESAGATVPKDANGQPAITVAISPAVALDANDLAASATPLPTLEPGTAVYIE